MPIFPRKRLGDILLEAGLITADQLHTALEINKATGAQTGEILINLGFVNDEDIKRALSQQLGFPYVALRDTGIDAQVARMIPEEMAKRYRAVPLRRYGNRLVVGMADPLNVFAIDDIHFTTGHEVDIVIMTEKDLEKAINQIYQLQKIQAEVVQQAQEQASAADQSEQERLAQLTEEAPIVRLVNSIIEGALRDRASDIHIEPQEDKLRIRYRIDGMLYDAMDAPVVSSAAVVSRLKILSGMDIAERRVPQDGRIKMVQGTEEIDLRVSTLPVLQGEKMVVRVLRKSSINLRLDELGMDRHSLNLFERIIRHPYGMLLVTGPTGSGKTTTLYSALTAMNASERNVVTIEDPVEYRLQGINQVNVNPKAGLTFATALRAVLRQDPNIVMIGEVRDGETADVAVRAALTGHLVLSTLHTNDAPSSVARLMDMGLEPYLVASSLTGVVAQRLVRKVCPFCREQYTPAPDAPERVILGAAPDAHLTLSRGKGCDSCNGTGYQGRIGVFEVMLVQGELRQMTLARAAGDELRERAIALGMRTLRQDAVEKCLRGITTVQEVIRITYDEVS